VNTTWQQAAALFALLVVTALVVSPVFDNGFVYDDTKVILKGTVIHDPANLPALFTQHAMFVSSDDPGETSLDTYRPMTLVSFFWDSAISGRDPFAYHLTNLVMHLLCVSLVFLLLRVLLGGHWGFALLGAAWFALSPHPNTAQIWINGRSDLFCTAYGLAAILVWRRALDGDTSKQRAVGHVVAALLFLAGLLSKETLLFVLPMLWLWPESSGTFGPVERIRRMLPLAAAGGAYLALRSVVLGGMRAGDGSSHLWTALQYLAPLELEGIAGALGPRRLYLRFLYDEFSRLSPLALAALALVFIALMVGVFAVRKRAPVVAWGLLWFVVTLAPVALVASILWPGFGRYLYLPSVGLAASIAACARLAWERFPRLRLAQALGAVAYLAFLGVNLHSWVGDFKDIETLYGSAIRKNPEGAHAYGWLGMAYRDAGRAEDSIGPLAKARELAPNAPAYTQHLLYALIATKRDAAALALARECVSQHPEHAEECHLYLYTDAQLARPADAMNHLLDCLRDDDEGARCYEAFAHAVNAHQLGPVYRKLAEVRLQEDDMAEVRERTEQVMRAN
jgi:tetratricopeptide (TPR) repeat protein